MDEKGNKKPAIDIDLSGSTIGRDLKIENLTVNADPNVLTDAEKLGRPWNLTQTQNKYFTGREDVLDKLSESFQGNSRAAVTARQTLHGLGGIGKTQLAIEFCYRNRDNYDLVWWVDAEEETNILSALAAFAELQGYQAENQLDLAKKAILWFNANKDWLLVFDNAPNAKAIEAYIPSSEHGHVLITSRWKNWDGVASDVKIDVWSEEEALDFLKDRLGNIGSEGSNEPELKKLAEEMGRLPLAIAHAAAYISTKQVSVSKYLELYSEYRADLHLSEEQLNNYDNNVAAAILLSVKDLEEQNKDIALALLYHCVFLPPEGIDTSFFIDSREALQEELSEALQNPIKVNKYWHDLELLSLIDKQGENIFIHRVVQAVLLDSLEENEKAIVFQNSLELLILSFDFKLGDFKTWDNAKRISPYVTQFCDHNLFSKYLLNGQSYLCDRLASYFHTIPALYLVAERYFSKAIKISTEIVDEEYPEHAGYLNNFAGLLLDSGRYEEAEQLFRKGLEIDRKFVGIKHQNYSIRLKNLALLLGSMGKYKEAEQLHREGIDIDRETIGEEHQNYATGLNNLALLLTRMGGYVEAERLFLEVIKIDKQTIRMSHPDYASHINNLALLLEATGRYEEAELFFREAIKVDIKTVGKEHPSYSLHLNNLASILRIMGRYEEAVVFFEEGLAIDKDIIGAKHPEYAVRLNNFAIFFLELGKYGKAEQLFKEAIDIDKNTNGEERQEYAIHLGNLASLYIKLNRIKEARNLLILSEKILKSKLGSQHPMTQQITELLRKVI